MEIHVFPAGFMATTATVPQRDGTPVAAMQLRILDAAGTGIVATFGMRDWEAFQRFVADPEGAAAAAEARSKIIVPPGPARAGSVKSRKH